MSGIVAQGRPPTGSLWGTLSAQPLQTRAKQYRASGSSGPSRLKKTTQHPWKLKSEPGLAEKAIEIASEVLDTDLTEVIETVQTTATDAAVTTQAAFQVRNWRHGLESGFLFPYDAALYFRLRLQGVVDIIAVFKAFLIGTRPNCNFPGANSALGPLRDWIFLTLASIHEFEMGQTRD